MDSLATVTTVASGSTKAAIKPEQYINKKVYKEFPNFGWFDGVVSSFSPDTGYRIEYADGDSEDVNEAEMLRITRQAENPSSASENVANQRRSGRVVRSTLTYIDGYAVKKDNNYVVKGMTYQFGADGTDALPKKTVQKKPPALRQAKKPRFVSPIEAQRRTQKEAVEQRILAKTATRQGFLRDNLAALEPFVEEHVAERIGSFKDETVPVKSVVMQPDLIDKATLRDYQLEGLNFMSAMYQRNIGMILGDEMGLVRGIVTLF